MRNLRLNLIYLSFFVQYSYLSNRKIIHVSYEYNAAYTTKYSATCYDENLNSSGEICFNTSTVCQV